ncbi:MAG: hypothetical protein HY706_00080 [Candidatus Hydrogenedentes bacterium]|nr:hypothetical protein [Candidatus Hydrogenedentota bacterium]
MGLSKKQLKIVESLDRSVQLCRQFMNDWLLFNQILSAYPSPGVNKAQLENEFLKIKSKLAREHQVLRESLKMDYKLDVNTMNIVSGATNLEAIYSQSEVAIKKLQNEWHRAFISVNETLGGLEDKKARAEAGQKVFLDPMDAMRSGGMSKKAKNNLIAAVVVIVVIAALMAIPQVRDMYMGAFQDFFGK